MHSLRNKPEQKEIERDEEKKERRRYGAGSIGGKR
jgi:hypothetical protein